MISAEGLTPIGDQIEKGNAENVRVGSSPRNLLLEPSLGTNVERNETLPGIYTSIRPY